MSNHVISPAAMENVRMPELESIAPGIWKVTFGTPEEITPVSVRCSEPALDRLPPVSPTVASPIPLDKIGFRVAARGVVVELPYDLNEGIFGLGLQLKSHLQSGKKKQLRVNADPVADTGDSHAPVPFFASTHGYGVYIDTARYLSIYTGTHVSLEELPERLAQKHGEPIANVEELYKGHAIGKKIVLDIPTARGVTLYLFSGPDIQTAVARYVLFSGGGCLPPLWSLGNWYRAYTKHRADEVLSLADNLKADRLPFSVMGLEPGWQSHFYPNSFIWSDRFPRPGEFIAELKKRGYHFNLWENAFVHPEAPFAAAIAPYCADYPSTDGLTPDFLMQEAKTIFANHHQQLVAEGASGFKLDECDNGDFIPFAWSFPEHAQFPSGADGEQMHCLYGVHYQHTLDDVFRKSGRRHFDLVRSSGSLAAPLPYVLYSDLYGHLDFLRGMVGAGFSGLLWTPELRHAESVEDLIRRLQSVVLSPLSLVNGWYIPRPPWKQVHSDLNQAGQDMDEAERATDLARAVLQLRMKLLPYLYSAFAHYRLAGVPPFRSLAMDFPQDKMTWICDRQWMIGRDLLVAPLVAGEKELDVYLPEGTMWREFLTGRLLPGGQKHRVENPDLSYIPMYVKDGAILPLAEETDQLSSKTVFTLRPHIYTTIRAACDLYDDDGETFGYQEGKYTYLKLEWDPAGGCQLAAPNSPYRSERYRLGEAVLLNPK
jgi:alpha-D-xyloside xylohydrolase